MRHLSEGIRTQKIVDNAIQKEKNDRLLIKSTISLCVLLAMYHLVLERKNTSLQ
jgi:hypothetical protein